jgi:hypothetical protein
LQTDALSEFNRGFLHRKHAIEPHNIRMGAYDALDGLLGLLEGAVD